MFQRAVKVLNYCALIVDHVYIGLLTYNLHLHVHIHAGLVKYNLVNSDISCIFPI